MEIKFKRDTSFRKQFFVPESFAHPAKMDAQLLLWIVNRYSEAGETILDPMAGSGTTILACTLGRNCILVELEEKFCKMMRDNWEQVKMRPQLGSTMGNCQIIQGDARQLKGLQGGWLVADDSEVAVASGHSQKGNERKPALQVDKIVTSPPHGDSNVRRGDKAFNTVGAGESMEYGYTEGQLANLPYGEIDKCIFSPPYAENIDKRKDQTQFKETDEGWRGLTARKYGYKEVGSGDNLDNISNLPYGQIDKIVTSPPYENQIHKGSAQPGPNGNVVVGDDYVKSANNIGNLKSQSYLEAMLQVYQQCLAVLRSGGLMVLVCKNFIRNKAVVRLDLDTIKLCEQAGFKFLERHYRELPSQSFWRVIYHQKFPDVEEIKSEDVLVFVK